ncbi:MAG: EscU/YscU/HrcU family type III secretion system export apparatus switch protein [Acidobacteria bacterium]|nr:EscU/YscU/HrcU family type III secretion system export apparatus switch protein [Acidobacteriota bacterium]
MPGERTEQATPQRREKARRDGDTLRSRELSSAAGMLAGVLCLGWFAGRVVEGFRRVFASVLNQVPIDRMDTGVAMRDSVLAMRKPLLEASVPVLVMMAAIVSGTVACSLIQGGGLQVRVKALGPHLDRINPAANAKNIFSLRAMARVGKSIIPAGVLGVLAYQRIAHQLLVSPFSSQRLVILGADVYGLLTAAAWLLLGWSLIDYAVEWRSRESRLMMSREELKQEYKEMEGSPQTRSRIRGLQRQMRRRKVKADIAKAAVVLTNPTHYAVALGFDFATMEAPKVLAKGRNLLAEEIKTEARWAGVPIVENPPVARSLYRSVEVGQAIPADLYAAVAAILAYLYRQRAEEEARRNHERSLRAAPKAKPASEPKSDSQSNQRKGER